MVFSGLLLLLFISIVFIGTSAQCPSSYTYCDYTNAFLACGSNFCGFSDCSYNCDISSCVFNNGACGCVLSTPLSVCNSIFYQDYSKCTYSCDTPGSGKKSGGCIAAHQQVITYGNAVKTIKNLALGDKVLTDKGFQDYMGNIHSGDVYPTKIIYTEDGDDIELTYEHFVKTENGFLHAHKIIVGDVVMTRYGKSKVIKTNNSTSYVMSPFTRSGTIIVNNVVLSCYATDRSHYLANIAFIPVRTGMIDDVEKYFETLLYILNKLPMWAKPYISTSVQNVA